MVDSAGCAQLLQLLLVLLASSQVLLHKLLLHRAAACQQRLKLTLLHGHHLAALLHGVCVDAADGTDADGGRGLATCCWTHHHGR